MKKIFLFILGIVATVGVITVVVQINSFLYTPTRIVEITDVDSSALPIDTILIPGGMTDEEFITDMMKGVQGDLTLEQVDSMQKSWAEQGNDFGD